MLLELFVLIVERKDGSEELRTVIRHELPRLDQSEKSTDGHFRDKRNIDQV